MNIKKEHWKLVSHSLGVNLYNAIHSKKYEDKFLPKEFYRNYFATSKGTDSYKLFKDLEKIEYVKCWEQYDKIYFGVTELGIEKFKEFFDKEITSKARKPTKSQLKYQQYLALDTDLTFAEYLGIKKVKKS